MPVFEVTAAGFIGGTDATDDRVFWVESDNAETVEQAVAGTAATFHGKIEVEQDIDFRLPAQAAEFQQALRRFAEPVVATKPSFVPTAAMISAAESVFLAMAYVQTIRPTVEAYKGAILAKGQWHVALKYTERLGGEVVTDPKESYLLGDADFAEYDRQCRAARDQVGIRVDEDAQCPLLVAESLEIEAKHALIDSMTERTGLTVERLLCGGMDSYNEAIELTLRLLAPFVKGRMPTAG